jgi:hypothetical protein
MPPERKKTKTKERKRRLYPGNLLNKETHNPKTASREEIKIQSCYNILSKISKVSSFQ